MLNSARVIVDLLLHLRFVFLEVSQALLQKCVLLLLRCDCCVVGIAGKLQLWDDVRHVVLVDGFKHVSHLFNLSSVVLRQFLVVLEFLVGVGKFLLLCKEGVRNLAKDRSGMCTLTLSLLM